MTALVLGATGVILLIAGPIMIARGLAGMSSIVRELDSQHITFPARDRLPTALTRFAGTQVRTGNQARAYSELIASHLVGSTGGRTYAEIADEWLAGGRNDQQLERLQETAFRGQTLRGALLGAYHAWQVTMLVIGLGAVLVSVGIAFLVLAHRVG